MEQKVEKAEGILRVLSMVLAATSAAIVGLDEETKTVFFTRKKATSQKLQVLADFIIIASVASGYHLLQLCRWISVSWLRRNNAQMNNKFLAWIWLLLDQGLTYTVFATTVAALEASMVSLIGIKQLQWSKLCNVYGRFCGQIAGGLLCGFAASITMAAVSSLSARNLFRLYSVYRRGEISNPKRWRWNLFYSSFS